MTRNSCTGLPRCGIVTSTVATIGAALTTWLHEPRLLATALERQRQLKALMQAAEAATEAGTAVHSSLVLQAGERMSARLDWLVEDKEEVSPEDPDGSEDEATNGIAAAGGGDATDSKAAADGEEAKDEEAIDSEAAADGEADEAESGS